MKRNRFTGATVVDRDRRRRYRVQEDGSLRRTDLPEGRRRISKKQRIRSRRGQ